MRSPEKMGDQNAPERIRWIYESADGGLSDLGREPLPREEPYTAGYVEVDVYRRAIAERDEARKLAWIDPETGEAFRELSTREKSFLLVADRDKARADRYRADAREAVAALESDSSAEARIEAALIFLRAVLAEGEQPAGDGEEWHDYEPSVLAVERVAKLLHEQETTAKPWDDCVEATREYQRERARGVLTAGYLAGEWRKYPGPPVGAEREAVDRAWDVMPAAGEQSTTEAATGHEYSLIDAVLPAEGELRDELIRLMIAKTLSETRIEDALISGYDVLREAIDATAAAPATPEGPDA